MLRPDNVGLTYSDASVRRAFESQTRVPKATGNAVIGTCVTCLNKLCTIDIFREQVRSTRHRVLTQAKAPDPIMSCQPRNILRLEGETNLSKIEPNIYNTHLQAVVLQDAKTTASRLRCQIQPWLARCKGWRKKGLTYLKLTNPNGMDRQPMSARQTQGFSMSPWVI